LDVALVEAGNEIEFLSHICIPWREFLGNAKAVNQKTGYELLGKS